MTLFILALVGILTLSFFILKDAQSQSPDILDEEDDDTDDPTTTCWDNNHTEHGFD
jgi:hypothetical protein